MIHRPRLHVPTLFPGIPRALQIPVTLAAALAASLTLLGMVVNAGPGAFFGAPALDQITSTVSRYVNQWQPLVDPLVTLDNGVQVKSSSMYGLEIDGTRYYYRLLHSFSYDPLSRGEATEYQVVARLDPGTEWEVEIYRLK